MTVPAKSGAADTIKFLSVCSGIEAASVAWGPLGWEAVAFSEIEKFPSAVLAHHYPHVPNWGDMTKFKDWPDATFDVLAGGTPCQSFSVAGLRRGMADPRGNLALVFLGIADRYRPSWVVWENVPGVLSSNGGRDFGAFLGGLAELGYGFAYRVLDAQYFGLAQRRKRVIVVAHLGDWRRAAAVLFEPESLSGYPAPCREAREDTAPTFSARTRGGGGLGTDFDLDGGLIAAPELAATLTRGAESGGRGGYAGRRQEDDHNIVAHTLNAKGGAGRIDAESETFVVAHTLKASGFDASEDGTGRGVPLVPMQVSGGHGSNGAGIGADGDPMMTLQAGVQHAVAFAENSRAELRLEGGDGLTVAALKTGWRVRRLTPRECERLQGFPDDYTAIPYRGVSPEKITDDWLKYVRRGNLKNLSREDVAKLAADGPRYKALGNSWAVPKMRWVGRRLASVHTATYQSEDLETWILKL